MRFSHVNLEKRISERESFFGYLLESDSQEIIDQRNLYEGSLYAFVCDAWHVIAPGTPFVGGWHMEAICQHLEALYSGGIRNLIVNIPPRLSKSTICSVCFPAWVWAREPSSNFLCTSYAISLALRDSSLTRMVINSNWYRKYWGRKFSLLRDTNAKKEFRNTKGGSRISTSVGGSNTGHGGDYIIFDDPNNVHEIYSETIRESVIDWFVTVMPTRLNNPKTGRRLLVQQRSHTRDLSGYILDHDINREWTLLKIPMEYMADRPCVTILGNKKWKDPRKKEGDLICPSRFGRKETESLKSIMASDAVAGQLQQEPYPPGGGLFKEDHWNLWEGGIPDFEYVLQSWDTAITVGKDSCSSSCVTVGIFRDSFICGGSPQLMFISFFKGKLEYPDLRRMALRLSNNVYDVDFNNPIGGNLSPDSIIIEAKANGPSLIQDLNRLGVQAMPFHVKSRENDKFFRARIAATMVESGRVWLPMCPPSFRVVRSDALKFVKECSSYKSGESNDVVDAFSQAVIRVRQSNLITHPEDLPDDYFPVGGKGISLY